MSEELAKLRQTLDQVNGHLQDMQSGQSQTVRELSRTAEVMGGLQQSVGELQKNVGELQKNVGELQKNVGELHKDVGELQSCVKNLQARAITQEAATIALTGTFANLDRILTRMLTEHAEVVDSVAGLKHENQELKGTLTDLLRRVEALERRAS